jgi:hypothetical protein
MATTLEPLLDCAAPPSTATVARFCWTMGKYRRSVMGQPAAGVPACNEWLPRVEPAGSTATSGTAGYGAIEPSHVASLSAYCCPIPAVRNTRRDRLSWMEGRPSPKPRKRRSRAGTLRSREQYPISRECPRHCCQIEPQHRRRRARVPETLVRCWVARAIGPQGQNGSRGPVARLVTLELEDRHR